MAKKISVIICAAGRGERAGFDKNKLLTPLCGAPVIWHTVKKFAIPEISEIVVTASKTDLKEIAAICKPFGCKVVHGGKTRTESVKKALKAVTGEYVLIHDGARPFVSKELILSCIDAVEKFGSGICSVKLTDTAVCAHYGLVSDLLDRENTFRVQTPQGFVTEDIIRAYELAGKKEYTDDSAVYSEFIAPAHLIEGSESNRKLTYKSDFHTEMPPLPPVSAKKIGFGVDVHAFCEGSGIVLGGVNIPCNRALAAHSDGDVIIHALMDALLSSAGLKDIGHYFPDDTDEFAGADSKDMLKKVIEMLSEKSLKPVSISISVQAETPRLAPYIDVMANVLSGICGVNRQNIAISAGTCEKLGFVGEEAGIAAYAAVLVSEAENG